MANTPGEEEMARQASFIFKGTVRKLKASNVAQVSARDKSSTVLVRVDEIIQAPDAFDEFNGKEVTVKLRDDKRLKVSDQAVFYTNGWIRAENLAVEEVGHRLIKGAAAASDAARDRVAGKPSSRDTEKRLSSADMVVAGRVAGIRVPEDAAQSSGGSATLDKPAKFFPTGERDPKWREAVVEVAHVLKGARGQKNIVVRFPANTDARWPQARKFETGQEGIFILHKTRKADDTAEGRPAATATDEEAQTTATALTALHPADFQPLDQLAEIKRVIEADRG